jgi:hypothetical protein
MGERLCLTFTGSPVCRLVPMVPFLERVICWGFTLVITGHSEH